MTFFLRPEWATALPDKAGVWGDSFGFVNAILSALAFAGVLVNRLSPDTASRVFRETLPLGGKPLLLQIMTSEAVHRGVRFYRTGTHVWLSTCIPSECFQIWSTEPFDIDDWNIESQETRELELDFLSCTSELGDIADAKNH